MTFRLALVLTLLAAPALAENPPAGDDMAAFEKDLDALFVHGGLTADAAAARAGAASPTVRRRIAEVDAATAQAESAENQLVPQIRLRAAYTRFSFLPSVTFPNPTGGAAFSIPFLQNSYLAEGNLVVPISDYVYRLPKLVRGAKLGEQAARATSRAAEVAAGADARIDYYNWVRARLEVLVAQRQLVQVQATLKQVRALAEVQRLSRADLLRFESQEAQAEQTLDQLTNAAALREEQLRLAIDARADEPLAIGEDIRQDLTAPGMAKLDDLMAHAEQRRLEFRALDVGIEAKELQRKAEVANYYPKLNAFGVTDYANPNPRVFPQADEWKLTWSAGLTVIMFVDDALYSRTNEHRLRAEANELRADRESLRRGTRIEVLAATQAVQIAVHALATTQKGLVAAEEGYRVRKELLAAQRATAVELVDAETELTRARIAALDARVDLRVAIAQLAHALGDDTK